VDAEREGGICSSAGDMGVGAYAETGAETGAGAGAGEGGGGSLTPRVSCGGETGESDGGCAGWGAGAVAERVGVGTGVDVDVGAAVDTAPVSSETYLSATGFPEKNSPEVRAGSIEGAGGKMSDWKESDWRGGASIAVLWL
jgi:hypothetical protein